MATRSEKLNRLVIQSPCPKAWDEMTGTDAQRHCAECDRQVFDFRSMTPRQIATRIEASRGHLCARLTRGSDGRLLTLPPFEPMNPSSWTAHRASPVAAAVVSALLGLGQASAKPLPQTPAAAVGTTDGNRAPAPDADGKGGGGTAQLQGNVHDESGAPQTGFQVLAINTLDGQQRSTVTGDEGNFAFDDLGAGVYALDISSDTFSAEPIMDVVIQPGENRRIGLTVSPKVDESSVLSGVLVMAQEPLRRVYAESSLVVLATAGKTRAAGPDSDEVITDLSVDLTFKGSAPKRSVRLYHAAPYEGEGVAYPPGTKVLALLNLRDGESGPSYEVADYYSGVTPLSQAELPVYRERIEKLARLLAAGEPHPADLAEWLVATAEEPLTRKMVTTEISDAFSALDRFAEAKQQTAGQAAEDLRAVVAHFLAEGRSFENEPAPEMVAAFFTDEHRERLVRALEATPAYTEDGFALYSLVKTQQEEAARAWLTRAVAGLDPASTDISIDTLDLFADELDDQALKTRVDSAREALAEIDAVQPEVPSPEQSSLHDARYAAVRRELIRSFQEALAAAR